MLEKLRAFEQKRNYFSQGLRAIHLRQSKRAQREKDSVLLTEGNRIIRNLIWIEGALNKAQFELNDSSLNEAKLDVYLEIVDYALSFTSQEHKNYKAFYQKNGKKELELSPKWLATSLELLLWLEKILAFSTLILAASPVIIVTTLPAIFSVAVNLITPLLLLLPALTIATAVVGVVLLGLKLTQVMLEKYGNAETKIELNTAENVKHEAAEKLLNSHQSLTRMKGSQEQRFFAPAKTIKTEQTDNRANLVMHT